MDLSTILNSRAVRSLESIPDKRSLIRHVSGVAALVYKLDTSTVLQVLTDREKLGSTGVGRGIAIPHARMEGLPKVIGLFTRISSPVDFGSIDNRPVDLVFTLLAPAGEGAEHLKALAMVSRTLRDKAVCDKLRANVSPQTLFTILCQASLPKAA
ncbi:MAG: PTS sugar transporter subunit IIA [Paracoccaceae bacterium]|nr:PTS sugar transporter subunit IIA [Paracoccaceae bacterium]MDE2913560.1 PTS sugar transporter subunit IIA [Paracoccaceae bacterium]